MVPQSEVVRRAEQYLYWCGEAVRWSTAGLPGDTWKVSIVSRGKRAEVGRVDAAHPRFTVEHPGSYLLEGAGVRIPFEVLEFSYEGAPAAILMKGSSLRTSLLVHPPLQNVRLEWRVQEPGQSPRVVEGATFSTVVSRVGRSVLHPGIVLPGQPPRMTPASLTYDVLELRAEAVGRGPYRAGSLVEFRVLSEQAPDEEREYLWTASSVTERLLLKTTSARARIRFPKPDRYRVQVQLGEAVSEFVSVDVYDVKVLNTSGYEISTARLALLESAIGGSGRLLADGLDALVDGIRVVVQDPADDAPAMVQIATFSRDGREINVPVRHALGQERGFLASRTVVLVNDPVDDETPVGGLADNATNDPTLLALTHGKVEVRYRGAVAVEVPIIPSKLLRIPVRFFFVRPSPAFRFPGRTELTRLVDERLLHANRIWEPFGLAFERSHVEIADLPRNLLLVTGRAAGVGPHGERGRAGIIVNKLEWSVSTAWSLEGSAMTPSVTVGALLKELGEEWLVDRFDSVFPVDSGGIVLRIRRRDGRPVQLEPLKRGQDVTQSVAPLINPGSESGRILLQSELFGMEEVALLLGIRGEAGPGVDIVVVGSISDDPRGVLHKAYPEGTHRSSLARSAIVSWDLLRERGKYPFLIARLVGEALAGTQDLPRERLSLFSDPPSEEGNFISRKRVPQSVGEQIYRRARALLDDE